MELSKGAPTTKLYTSALLSLAVELANTPLIAAHPLQGFARSRTCGSDIRFSAVLGGGGTIEQFGMAVSACAVGQAAAAIFAQTANGTGLTEIAETQVALGKWLTYEAPTPNIMRLEMIEPARAFPARHEAIMLPWRAAIDALS